MRHEYWFYADIEKVSVRRPPRFHCSFGPASDFGMPHRRTGEKYRVVS